MKEGESHVSFWETVEVAAGMGKRYHWVLLGLIVVALLLGALRPDARARLRVAVLLIIASFVAMLACGAILHGGALDWQAAGVRYVHFASQIMLAIGVINLGSVLLFRVLLGQLKLEPAPILRDTLLGITYIVVAITLLARHGVNLSGIVATSAVVTAVIGFSLQDTLGNIMGGVALQLERSIAVGDWVRVGDVEGVVREIRWRQTSIETRSWDTVVLPNSQLMKSQVTIWGRRAGKPRLHRIAVEFLVDYQYLPGDVIGAVERALRAEAIPNVARDPQPDCVVREFKESAEQYAVRYWLTDFAKDTPTSSEVRERLFVALRRAGIPFYASAMNVLMTMENRSRAERMRQEEAARRVAALRGVNLFDPLTDAERAEVSDRLSAAPFRRGEVITRQGNEAHFLYILAKGEAEVRVAAGSGSDSHPVAKLGPGQVFGEMGLMTGERRTATVVALADAMCYRLDKEGFQDVLRRRPEIAEAISKLLAERKAELDAKTQGLDAEAARQQARRTQGDLLQSIRRFFMLEGL